MCMNVLFYYINKPEYSITGLEEYWRVGWIEPGFYINDKQEHEKSELVWRVVQVVQVVRVVQVCISTEEQRNVY